jgi:PAS domain S-box-containing protein
LLANDDRSLGEVVESVVGPYRHLRLLPDSGRSLASGHQMLDALGEGVAALDQNQCIQSVNPAFQNLTGYTPGELAQMAIGDLDAGEQDQRLGTGGQERDAWRGEVRIRRKD